MNNNRKTHPLLAFPFQTKRQAIVAAENANKGGESAAATGGGGGGGGVSGVASGAFAAVAAAAAAAVSTLVSPLSPQPSRKSTTVSETTEQHQEGSLAANANASALPPPALAAGATAGASTTLPPLPPQFSRAKASTATAATTLDASHLDGGLLSSLESLLRSSPSRHRMRVAGLRLLAALAAAGGALFLCVFLLFFFEFFLSFLVSRVGRKKTHSLFSLFPSNFPPSNNRRRCGAQAAAPGLGQQEERRFFCRR